MPILVPGQTCWRIERADRLCVIVDAAEYFRAVKSSMLKAHHNILLIGWDFDTRVEIEQGSPTLEGPNRLGPFMKWLVKRNPDLSLRVLKWDLGIWQALSRGMLPMIVSHWVGQRRLHMKLDGKHPIGAAHHQKIVVIDDTMAFCGGIDITAERWDVREHLDHDPRRQGPHGKACGPWHDATTAVDGAVARAIGDVARDRWQAATSERLVAVDDANDAWPEHLTPTLRDVDVGIARTLPEMEDREAVREIEALYLTAIAHATRSIYLESQYLASRRIAEALARRLEENDGPEVIVVLPEGIEGWLEHEAMDGARARLLHMLWRTDLHGRFGAYYPVTEGGHSIYVHAKIMVIDDTLLRVGSSNLNNRSQGFDTECDLAIEADVSDTDLHARIASVRRDLLCEHLAIGIDEHDACLKQTGGSLKDLIEALRGSGRSLRPFDPEEIEDDDSPLAENALLDPEQVTLGFGQRLQRGLAAFTKRGR